MNKIDLKEDHWAMILSGIIISVIVVISFINPSLLSGIPKFAWSGNEDLNSTVFSSINLERLMTYAIILMTGIAWSMGWRSFKSIIGFIILIFWAYFSLFLSGNKSISHYGLEYVVFALLIGLILRNFNIAPSWLLSMARSELYIKTGLIILGTSVLFTDILKAGIPGIAQALIVVLVVWFVSLLISRKLKVDDEYGVLIASAVSICGVSAAIVASGAIQGDKKKLSYVTTLVLLVAIPMLILQPWIIQNFKIPEIIGGAWLGGTLDTTASVTAASQLVGPLATKAGVIVKFSQNVLIGVAALFISAWWAMRQSKSSSHNTKLNYRLIWDRFPKFVIGFLVASILFSFVLPIESIKASSGMLTSLRTIWFALAFVSIGLEANFKDLIGKEEKRTALSFVLAQLFNIFWTLLWSYILFGGYIFAVPDLSK